MPYSVILTEIWHPFSQSCSNRCSFRNFGLNLFYEHLSNGGAALFEMRSICGDVDCP